jgi:polysaccharide biosynthesis/export protein
MALRIMGFRPVVAVLLTIGCLGLLSLQAACTAPRKHTDQFHPIVTNDQSLGTLRAVETASQMTVEKASVRPDFQIIEQVPVPNAPEYRLGSGDVLEIVYHIHYEKTREDYHLDVQDRISITFPYHPQFSSTVQVRTDGKISVPLLGDVDAESKTPSQLAAYLNRAYSKYIQNPSVTVALEEFNVKIDELKKAITTAPRGQSKIAPVATDGRIGFPIIGSLQAEGLTLVQLEKLVNEKYVKFVRNLDVTLILLEIHHPKFYILGEVERPGSYEMTSRLNLLDSIAMANGHKKSAYLKEVIVFRNDGMDKPVVFKIDLESALKHGTSYFSDLIVRPADIIYVPKTKIDDFNVLVEKIFTKGLYAILPFQSSFTVNYDIRGWGMK